MDAPFLLELNNIMQNKNSTESGGNLYHKLKSKFTSYLNLGITDSENDFQNARTFILNAISTISIVFLTIAYLIIGLSAGFLKYAWIPLLTPHLFYVLYLNSKGKFEKAKVVFMVINIISIGAISLLMRGDGVEYNLMVTICLVPFLFSKKRTLFAFIAASGLMFLGVRYLAMVLPETDLYDVNHKLVSSISLAFAAISTLFLIIVFQRFSNKVSNSLIAKNERVKEKLTESKQNYRSLFENMIEGFAYCEMVFENGRPSDFIYLDVNAAFEKQTGLKDVIGKKISEVVPGVKESIPEWFEIYGRVALSGNPERFESFSPQLERWYDISAYCPKTGYFVLVFDQITERKAAEKEIIELNENLEQKIEERTNDLSIVNKELAAKNQDITDSITYALRLQQAMLPDSKLLFRNYPDAFIINLPQNIVSGDFYWFNKSKHRFMIACADSTGHGVPGAFMSIVGSQLINHAVEQEWEEPSDILKLIDEGLSKTLTGNKGEKIADGMDMAFCIIDQPKNKIEFAGAMSSVILDESGKSQVYKGNRFGLGEYMKAKDKNFETQVIKYKSGDMLYLYSDGLKDQFGGDDDKKFMAKRQTELFEKVHNLPTHEQKQIIIKTFREWKGEKKQVDDVMVIGVRL